MFAVKLKRYESAIYLGVFALIAVINNLTTANGDALAMLQLFSIIAAFGSFLFWAFKKLSKRTLFFGDTIFTLLILLLIVNPATGWYEALLMLLAVFFAIFIKFFLKIGGPPPIFNPAAFGMVAALLIGTQLPENDFFVSWWGVTFFDLNLGGYQIQLSLLLLLGWLIFELRRYKRFMLFLSFMAAAFIAQDLIANNITTARESLADSTLWFFAAVMLVDPKTSPIGTWSQVWYGVFVAIVYTLFLNGNGFVASYFMLSALLVGNFFYFATKRLYSFAKAMMASN
jgi:hypothetical protein